NFEMRAEKVEECRLQCGHGVDRYAQVESLQAAATDIAIGERVARLLQDAQIIADRLTDQQSASVLDRLANFLAAGNFANAGMPGVVLDDRDVAREERSVRAAQVEQHAVAPSDGNDLKFDDQRDGHGCYPFYDGVSR